MFTVFFILLMIAVVLFSCVLSPRWGGDGQKESMINRLGKK